MFCPNCGKPNPSGAVYCNSCGRPFPPTYTSVKCPFCGADGQEYQLTCTSCGQDLPTRQKIDPFTGVALSPEAARTAPSAETGAQSISKPCPICGRPKDIYADKCEYCSRFEPEYPEEIYELDRGLAAWGGGLILISGILGVVMGLMFLVSVNESSSYWGHEVPWSAVCCSGISVVFGIIACAGGFSAFGRTSVWFAVAGGVFGMLAIGFVLGAVLAEIGIILVTIGYDEFKE